MIAFIAHQEKMSMLPENLRSGSMDVLDYTGKIRTVAEQLRGVQHYSFIIIDVDFFKDSVQEIQESLYLLKLMNTAHLLVIAQGRERGDPLLCRMIEMEIYDFITAIDPTIVQQQMDECIQGREYSQVEKYLPLEPDKKKKGIWSLPKLFAGKKKSLVQIGVAGVLSRIGTTTQAFRIVRYLADGGNRVCYVEENGSGHLEMIRKIFTGAEGDASSINYSGITMYYGGAKPDPEQYEYIITDYGTWSEKSSMMESEVPVIVAGSTAWEMAALAEILSFCPVKSDTRRFLFSFTAKEEESDLLDFMAERWKNTFFVGYCPDMFRAIQQEEREQYRKLFLPN